MVDHILRQTIFGGTLLLMALTLGVCIWTSQLEAQVAHSEYSQPLTLFQHLTSAAAPTGEAGGAATVNRPDSSQTR
ncbi:MAG TPA: hypothetical protein VL992_03430 [Tepidisphaeraceae bacterium]|nr:hypothetical protein [Tepidisphaeraceae bacterium]